MDQETLTAASKLRRPCYFHHAGWVSDCFLRPQTPQEKPWTEKLWIYDLRTNKHFTLKENTLNLDDFVACNNRKTVTNARKPTASNRSPTKICSNAIR